jgi:thiol-disulfide isomerase/thioredoxin
MTRLAATLLTACSLLPSVAAQTVGTTAPELVFDHRFHFGELEAHKLGDLRGSAVLVEFWGSHCEFCRSEIPHLNRLHGSRLDQGLVVIGITPERPATIEPYLAQHGVRFPIAIGDVRAYALSSVPDAVLVDPDGKILWRGRPYDLDDATIDKAMQGARPAHVAPGLEAVHALRCKNAHGDAFRALQQLLASAALEPRGKAQAERWLRDYESSIAAAMQTAAEATVEQDPYAAWAALQPIADWHVGIPGADRAKARLQELLADGRRRREVEAGRLYAEALAKEDRLDFDGADAACKEVVQRFATTRAGKNAVERRATYQREGKLGYRHACDRCKIAGAACTEHRRSGR